MQIPIELRLAIESLLEGKQSTTLNQSFNELSGKYRAGSSTNTFVQSDGDVLAYVAGRMPSIYAVAARILGEIKTRSPQYRPQNLLDIGSGPGTILWAAHSVWSELSAAQMLDSNASFRDCGARLANFGNAPLFRNTNWQSFNAESAQLQANEKFDLICASYMLGELSPTAQENLVRQAWQVLNGMLVLVEPGTPAGFKRILSARDLLISLGASIAAPCAAAGPCPITESKWCHFSERVERTSWQRRAKSAQLSFEDEKYSFLVVSTSAVAFDAIQSRIMDHPRISKIGLLTNVCDNKNEISELRITKREKERFKEAKHLKWGSFVPNNP